MKRKLKLFLCLAMTLSMIWGMTVAAFAQTDAPLEVESCNCEDANQVFGLRFIISYGEDAEDFLRYHAYKSDTGERYSSYSSGMYGPASEFPEGFIEGKVYHCGLDGKWHICTSNSPVDPPIVVPCVAPVEAAPEPAKPVAPPHVHNFTWQIITAPTQNADGLEGEMCSCGATRNTQLISAYAYTLDEYALPMINAAKSGQTITFEFGEFNSFPKSFMEKLVEKSSQNVTFVFKYKWNHTLQTITIPAGTTIDLNFDWYGPQKMQELYGAY